MRKLDSCLCKNKVAELFHYTDSTMMTPFEDTKFQASSHLLWLHRPDCVRPGRNPNDWFSRNTAQLVDTSPALFFFVKSTSTGF